MKALPLASISIDLDNKWAYLRTAKKSAWEGMPTYFPTVIPRVISHLARANIAATVFIVGRDLLDPQNIGPVRDLKNAGHRIGNHSLEHEPWLHTFDQPRIEREIGETDDLIQTHCGVSPVGFRGPGYSDSKLVHQVLVDRGYRYCASAFPSCVGPIARAFYLVRTGLKRDAERKEMFGSWSDALQKNSPYLLADTANKLWMIPVTTQPVTRLPIHFTYLFYLSEFSHSLAQAYFLASLRLCRWMGVAPSLLLHPLDFLGKEDEPEFSFFPGMRLNKGPKLALLDWFLGELTRSFQVHTMEGYLDRIEGIASEKSPLETRGIRQT